MVSHLPQSFTQSFSLQRNCTLYISDRGIGVTAVELGKKYKSDIVTLKVFHRRFTVINTYDLIKEYMLKNDNVVDRPGDGGLLGLFHPGHKGMI
jgi:hypothetical protein